MKIKKNVRLAPLSTFGIGGRAEYFCSVKTPEGLIEAIKFARQKGISHKIIAGGSNVVFSDGKNKGLFIKISGGKIERRGQKLIIGAGVPLSRVVEKSVALGLRGLETLAGIPGTIGGAIVGNAGAYGHSLKEVVEKAEIWDGKERRWLNARNCRFRYRESVFKEKPYVLLRAVLEFKKGSRRQLEKISREIIRIRLKKYNPGLKCPGSFFKNVLVKETPKSALRRIDKSKIIEGKIPAGYLLEEVGAKGMRLGGIKIADFHGNLLVNQGGATAKDVRKLAAILKKRVKSKFGITLEEEVRYF